MAKNLGMMSDPEALALLMPLDGKNVLDVGCGPGGLCRALAQRGATVRGFEPDPIQAQKNREAPAEDSVSFFEAPAQALPVASASTDLVILSKSLHHVPAEDMDAALKEAHRVLRANGTLVVMEPDIHGQFSQMIRPFHDETVVRALALEAMERAAPLFASNEEVWFTSQMRFESLDQFKGFMIGLSFNEFVTERIHLPEVEAAFEAGRDGEDYRFTNPIRVRMYQHPVR